jgi:cytochrome b subunit of formate dehydrogenase
MSKTDKPLPVCNDCHSSHAISRTDLDEFKRNIMDTCGKCHTEIAKTYFDTYHGKVYQLGSTKTAKCYDCHGAHDILSVTDPESHLSRQNVVDTCKKCHPQATRRFAGYLTHATHHDPQKYPWLFYTFWGMTSLLVVTFTISGIHTLLWLPRAFQMRRDIHRKLAARKGGKQFQRFTHLERFCHWLMIVSFISLALTGMTLKFSYTKWAFDLAKFLGGFESAGLIHRFAAIMMFGVFAIHLWDLTVNKKRERGSWKKLIFGPNSMMFNRRDLTELILSIKWFLGRKSRPSYGRWTYWEKFDYFAVFWGIFVIGSTGLLLWFSEFFTRILPGWLINVATIVHSDEALLAVGFIFTIHFFNTHLRPEKFPMDTVVFTGRVDIEELKNDKPDEYAQLVATGELEKNLVDPLPDVVVTAIRVFAWIALGVGLAIVAAIIYAMVFAYK